MTIEEPSFHIIENAEVQFNPYDILGETANSSVFYGTFRGAYVAIKMIHGYGSMQISAHDLRVSEIELLSSLRHPRILTLMGVVLDVDPRYGAICGLVTAYMKIESLSFLCCIRLTHQPTIA